ncbi:PepSY domain-containing protein [Paracoccus sp. S-4012]|nr:PepSY domain-containing protein [Paracoccus sp. S-4012]
MIPAASLAQTTPAPAGDAAAAPAATTAATTTTSGMLPLSEVIAALEARVGADLQQIEDVDWDDDGYWEIEYRNANGSETEVKIDPTTGEERPR